MRLRNSLLLLLVAATVWITLTNFAASAKFFFISIFMRKHSMVSFALAALVLPNNYNIVMGLALGIQVNRIRQA